MISKHFNWSRWALAWLVVVLAFALTCVFAQEYNAAIRGRVTDNNGNPLADVKITLRDLERGTTIEANTDNNGNFFHRGLYPSTYEITYVKEGYRTAKEELRIRMDRTPHRKITMEPFDPKASVKKEFDEGRQLFQQGKYQEAAGVFEKIVEQVTDYAEARYNLGLCYARIKDYDNAVPHLEKVIELAPDMIAAYGILGEAYLEQKEFEKMVDVYNKVLELDQNNPNYYTNLGIAYCNLRKNDEAIEVLDKAIVLDDTISLTYYLLGIAYNGKEDAEKTIENFEKFIELEPNAPQVPMIKEHIKRLKEQPSEQE